MRTPGISTSHHESFSGSDFLFPGLFFLFLRIVQLDADGAFFEGVADIEDVLRFYLEAEAGRGAAGVEALDLEALQLEAEASVKRDDRRAGPQNPKTPFDG